LLINNLIILFYDRSFKFKKTKTNPLSYFSLLKKKKTNLFLSFLKIKNIVGVLYFFKNKPFIFKKTNLLHYIRKSKFFNKNKLPRIRQICKNMVVFTLSLNIIFLLKTVEIYYGFTLKNNLSLCYLIFPLFTFTFFKNIFKDKKF
jgi:hypothetical protein